MRGWKPRVRTVSIDENRASSSTWRSIPPVALAQLGDRVGESCLLHGLSSNICSYGCPRVAAARFVGLEFG
jgi:hypothetical protein